ncbi:MAG TPA: hypothetical protein VGC41_01695, partial [Kofleriaceae bacterium]
MPDKDQRAKRDAADTAEFGSVEDVSNLAPDSNVSPSMQREVRARITDPTKTGHFENHGSDITSHLDIQESTKNKYSIWNDYTQDSYGVDIKRFQAGYNAYLIPYGETLRAEGRVKDLSMAGAPLAPADFQKKNPSVAQRLQATDSRQGNQEVAFNAWSSQEKTTVTEIRQFGALQHSMSSALKSYDRIQDRLKEKATKAKQDSAKAEIAKIEESAATLARITKVTYEGLGMMSEIEVAMASHAPFNENAEGAGDLSHVPQSGNTDYGHGTVDDKTSGQRQLGKNKGQVAGDAADTVKEQSEQTVRIVNYVSSTIAKGGELDLSLQSIFIVAEGSATKYADLQKDVAKLGASLAALQMSEENADMMAVKENLDAAKMSYSATKKAVEQDKSLS